MGIDIMQRESKLVPHPRDWLTLQKSKGGVILKSQRAWEIPGELGPPNQSGKIWAHRNWNVKCRVFTTSSTYISWLLGLCFWRPQAVGQVSLWLFCLLLGLLTSYWLVLIWELLPYHIISCYVMFWCCLLEVYSFLEGNKEGMDLEDGEGEEKLGKVDQEKSGVIGMYSKRESISIKVFK